MYYGVFPCVYSLKRRFKGLLVDHPASYQTRDLMAAYPPSHQTHSVGRWTSHQTIHGGVAHPPFHVSYKCRLNRLWALFMTYFVRIQTFPWKPIFPPLLSHANTIMWYFLLKICFSCNLFTYSLYLRDQQTIQTENGLCFWIILPHFKTPPPKRAVSGFSWNPIHPWVGCGCEWVGWLHHFRLGLWSVIVDSPHQRAVKTNGRVRHFIHSRLHNKNCFLCSSCIKTHIMMHDSAVFPPPFNWMEIRSHKAKENHL